MPERSYSIPCANTSASFHEVVEVSLAVMALIDSVSGTKLIATREAPKGRQPSTILVEIHVAATSTKPVFEGNVAPISCKILRNHAVLRV